MSRDHRKLRVFDLADRLVVDVYRVTRHLPRSETYGIQGQIRRAYLSTVLNIVEGSARLTHKDYVHFLHIALASASEARYALDLASRLELLEANVVTPLIRSSDELVRSLQKMISSLNSASGANAHPRSG